MTHVFVDFTFWVRNFDWEKNHAKKTTVWQFSLYFYSNFLGNHEIFFNTSAYIIYQSFFEIIILLFQFSYTDSKSISFIISNLFHNIKTVTVDNSSIVKSVKFSSKWSLDHFSSFFTSWDILIYIIWRHIIFSFYPWFF